MTEPMTPNAETGLRALYIEHRAELKRFLVARTGNATEAQDLMQDVWLRIEAERSGPIANGRAYLFRVANNLVLDHVRERGRRAARERDWADVALDQRAGEADPADPGAEVAAMLSQNVTRLAAAIAALPPGAGRAFRLHKIDGLSHAETAAQLGISRKGVEKHMAVAMAHLRRMLNDDNDAPAADGNWGDRRGRRHDQVTGDAS
jgi:RNA polymerase sigma-70 factor (ECF subfamily)